MRCPKCEHENPKNTPHCEVCGAVLSAPAGAAPIHPGRKFTSFEPAPFLPLRSPTPPLTSTPPLAPPAPFPPFSTTVSYQGGASPNPPVESPLASPMAPPVEGRRTVAEPAPVLPTKAPNLEVQSLLGQGGRVEPTQLVQSPDLGGPPQLRGALFEYRGVRHPGFIHTLRAGKNILGRDPTVCDVILEDERVSKQHAYLFLRDEEALFFDVSANGSTVNGRLIRGSDLRIESSTVLQIGGARLIFVFLPRRLVDGIP